MRFINGSGLYSGAGCISASTVDRACCPYYTAISKLHVFLQKEVVDKGLFFVVKTLQWAESTRYYVYVGIFTTHFFLLADIQDSLGEGQTGFYC